jgi:hypothetical protein
MRCRVISASRSWRSLIELFGVKSFEDEEDGGVTGARTASQPSVVLLAIYGVWFLKLASKAGSLQKGHIIVVSESDSSN